jgi:hypothetical protein
MRKHLILFLVLLLVSFNVKSETCFLSGKVNLSEVVNRSIKVVLYNNDFNDTTFVDSAFKYHFRNVPYGIYCILILGAHNETGYENLLVTDIIINCSILEIYPISLSKSKTCGCGVFLLGKKDTVEYYKTGEIYGKGHYKVSKKYYSKHKSVKYSYRKHGLWNYYYKNGKLLRKAIYDNNSLIFFNDFYPNGNKKMVGYYNDCKANTWEYYLDDGSIIFMVDFSQKFTTKINHRYLKGYIDNFEMIDNL